MDIQQDEFQLKNEQVSKSLEDLRDFPSLIDDALGCLELSQWDSQFIRRMRTRAVFALIEGTVFRMKQVALEASNLFGTELSKQETAILLEETYELNDKGEAFTKSQYIPLPKNIKFALKIMAQVFEADYHFNIGDNGWAAFLQSLKIRNRITHPKHLDGILISDKEMGLDS